MKFIVKHDSISYLLVVDYQKIKDISKFFDKTIEKLINQAKWESKD